MASDNYLVVICSDTTGFQRWGGGKKRKRTSGGNLFSINKFIPGVPLPEGMV